MAWTRHGQSYVQKGMKISCHHQEPILRMKRARSKDGRRASLANAYDQSKLPKKIWECIGTENLKDSASSKIKIGRWFICVYNFEAWLRNTWSLVANLLLTSVAQLWDTPFCCTANQASKYVLSCYCRVWLLGISVLWVAVLQNHAADDSRSSHHDQAIWLLHSSNHCVKP